LPEPSSPTEPPELAALAPDPWADRLWRWRRNLAISIAIAIGLVATATAIRIVLDRLIGDAAPFITYFPAIMIATLAGGLRSGIAATILSGLASWVLFVPPPVAPGATGRPLIAVFAASALVAVLAAALFNALAERVLARHRSVLLHRQGEAERQRLVIRELEHRTRNLFGLVKTIARASLRDGSDLAAGRDAFLDRLDAFALAYSNDPLSGDGRLSVLLERILTVHRDRIALRGCDVMLSEQALHQFALIAHELQTNAMKYGALSNATGRIAVDGHVEGSGSMAQFRFAWIESGGPRVVPPGRRGFGHTILYRSPTYDGARVSMDYRPEGFCYRYSIDLARIAARNGGSGRPTETR
jgi:two-component sensor histidine kinase